MNRVESNVYIQEGRPICEEDINQDGIRCDLGDSQVVGGVAQTLNGAVSLAIGSRGLHEKHSVYLNSKGESGRPQSSLV